MKNFTFILFTACVAHFSSSFIYADFSDEAKATYYDTKVKVKEAYKEASK